MLHLRIYSPSALTDAVVQVLRDEPAVGTLAVLAGACLEPPGDVVLADLARESANEVIDRLRAWSRANTVPWSTNRFVGMLVAICMYI